ncbi:MAG: hypothetical protein GY757_57470, partial [bacterium]|nr:hypothetical protein [bacterium]
MLGNKNAVAGFVHPEGIYDDPKGGRLRDAFYPRLRYHFQFANELSLFTEVDHHMKFSINVYKQTAGKKINFYSIANLYSTSTIDSCFEHSGYGFTPGVKDDNNNWNISGHKNRVLSIGRDELALFASLYDKPEHHRSRPAFRHFTHGSFWRYSLNLRRSLKNWETWRVTIYPWRCGM